MQIYRRFMMALMVLWIASGFAPGALAASAEDGNFMEAGALVRLDLSEEPEEYSFTPAANGLYAAYLLPVSENMTAKAELLEDGEIIAEGEGRLNLISARLTAGHTYTVRVSGDGTALMEIARETLSRSFGMPLEIADGEGYEKLIARAGDVHWYSVKAQSTGAALIAVAPEEKGLRMQARLFGEDGRRITTAEMLASGTAMISAVFEEGKTYYIRTAASEGGTGKYSLSMMRSENSVRPQSVEMTADALTIEGFAALPLSASAWPGNACGLIYLDSTDASVARAWSSGFVEGRMDGFAIVTAYAFGGARSSCRVTVERVSVEGVRLSTQEIRLAEGDSRSLIAALIPSNATDRRVQYASADEEIAAVDKNGVVTAVKEGTTAITVTAADGGFSETATVTVRKADPKYRALLVGEQNYAPTVETVREGSVKSVESLNSLLNATSFEFGSYRVETLMDASRDEVLAGIRETFADARESDISLVYLTCHGFYQAGMTFFVMTDGSVLSAADLERELRAVPGEIVLLLDCCGSGGALGKAGSPEDILDGVNRVFHGEVGGASVHGSKFRVIASAYLDQDSYRIGFGEGGMSTVFARALCDAAGWNMDLNAPSAMNADVDYNGEITLDELEKYLSKRVAWYLNLAGDYVQTVTVYPKNDPAVIFSRISE